MGDGPGAKLIAISPIHCCQCLLECARAAEAGLVDDHESDRPNDRFQFSLRSMVGLVAVASLICAVVPFGPVLVVVSAPILPGVIVFIIGESPHRENLAGFGLCLAVFGYIVGAILGGLLAG